MNILLMSQEYPPDTGGGGVGTHTFNLARALCDLGENVIVLSSVAPGQPPTDRLENGVRVRRIRRWKFQVPVARRAWYALYPNFKHQMEYAFGVRRELNTIIPRERIEVIEGPDIWGEGVLYQLRRHVPIVVRAHGSLFIQRQANQVPLTADWRRVETMDRRWFTRADRQLACSRSLAELLTAEYKLDSMAISVVPNSIDTQFWTYQPPAVTRLRLIQIGRREPAKGIATLVDALPRIVAEFPDLECWFVGGDTHHDGSSYTEQMQRRAKKLGVEGHTRFWGAVPREELRELIWQSDIGILTSRFEGYPFSALEMMACGRPVIVPDVYSMPEVVADGAAGIVVPPQEPAALAQAVTDLARQPERRTVLGRTAAALVAHRNSLSQLAHSSLAHYRQVRAEWDAKHGQNR